jgi:hypothetical protein
VRSRRREGCAQGTRLVAVRARAGEQVHRACELALAQDLSRERVDQPADGCQRNGRGFGPLGARLGAQHRDDVLDVEAGEQQVDEFAGALGIERAHLLERAAQVAPDRVVQPPQPVAALRCFDVARVRRTLQRVEETIDVFAD